MSYRTLCHDMLNLNVTTIIVFPTLILQPKQIDIQTKVVYTYMYHTGGIFVAHKFHEKFAFCGKTYE